MKSKSRKLLPHHTLKWNTDWAIITKHEDQLKRLLRKKRRKLNERLGRTNCREKET